MKIDEQTQSTIDRVIDFDSDIFSDLVAVANLDPAVDFKDADLKDVDFRGSDLSEFDFSHADLRGAKWEGVLSDPPNVRFALFGRGRDPVRSSDFDRLVDIVKEGRTWSERFFAYALCADNFGPSYLVFDLLKEIVTDDESTYMRDCSYTYFVGGLIQSEEHTAICRNMAEAGNSRTNMFRIGKVRRLAREAAQYMSNVRHYSRFPSAVPFEDVASLLRRL